MRSPAGCRVICFTRTKDFTLDFLLRALNVRRRSCLPLRAHRSLPSSPECGTTKCMTSTTMTGTALGARIIAHIDRLAAISESGTDLTRIFLSPEHRQAADLIRSWMEEAGMAARMDAIGNVVGRYEGDRPNLPALLLGSHY